MTQIRMHLGYQRCQRLIESGMLPGRDGQPLQLTVHADLAELRGQPAAAGLEAGWSTARAAAAGLPGSVYLSDCLKLTFTCPDCPAMLLVWPWSWRLMSGCWQRSSR